MTSFAGRAHGSKNHGRWRCRRCKNCPILMPEESRKLILGNWRVTDAALLIGAVAAIRAARTKYQQQVPCGNDRKKGRRKIRGADEAALQLVAWLKHRVEQRIRRRRRR